MSNRLLLTIVSVLIILLYMVALYRCMRNRKRIVRLAPLLAVYFAGFVSYLIGYASSHVGAEDPFLHGYVLNNILLSLISSFELFIADPHFYDLDFYYRSEAFQSTFILIYLLTLITSFSYLLDFFAKRLSTRFWFLTHIGAEKKTDKTYVFYGVNEESAILAADLLSNAGKQKRQIIFIDNPGRDAQSDRDGVKDIITQDKVPATDIISKYLKNRRHYAVLKSSINLEQTRATDKVGICRQLGLSGLEKWLNRIYILSDDQENNILVANRLSSASGMEQAKIFCKANPDRSYVMSYRSNLHYIDTSFMAVKQIKKDPNLHPVNTADIGLIDGKKGGWVASPYNAMVLGFGTTGQAAAKFIYEFASFTGHSVERNGDLYYPQTPLKCIVVDSKMYEKNAEGKSMYSRFVEGIAKDAVGDRIEYSNSEAGSVAFWKEFKPFITKLNYAVVALGDDITNIRTGLMLLSLVPDKKDIMVLVTVKDKKNFKGIDDPRLIPFGSKEDIWRETIVTNADIYHLASVFFENYKKASNTEGPAWLDRHAQMKAAMDRADLLEYSNIYRQELQDLSNCVHAYTKRRLCEDESNPEVMAHMTACEHMRWLALYEINGFTYGEQKDPVARIHNCMIPFEDLTDLLKYYDEAIVRATFDNEIYNK